MRDIVQDRRSNPKQFERLPDSAKAADDWRVQPKLKLTHIFIVEKPNFIPFLSEAEVGGKSSDVCKLARGLMDMSKQELSGG